MSYMNSIDKVNKLNKSDFISIFGNVFEKTEWIAQKSYDSKPYKNFEELFSKIFKNLSVNLSTLSKGLKANTFSAIQVVFSKTFPKIDIKSDLLNLLTLSTESIYDFFLS